MCRLLYIKSNNPFKASDHLLPFAQIAKNSKEYQGHGWGCSYLCDGQWKHYKNLRPVWEDDLYQFESSTLLLVHARSAFRDQDIRVENNMPFVSGNHVFIFNGELHGVRIREEGRTGAEKIFNFMLRMDHGELRKTVERSTAVIEKRTRYIRAFNAIIADKTDAVLTTMFNEDKAYFTMYQKNEPGLVMVCSEPYPDESDWVAIPNRTMRKLT